MKYIHYWHFANQWYMKINDNPKHERIPSGNEYKANSYNWQEEYLIPESVGFTHRQIKEWLIKQYPNLILVKEIAYHEGVRWFGNKDGSRNK